MYHEGQRGYAAYANLRTILAAPSGDCSAAGKFAHDEIPVPGSHDSFSYSKNPCSSLRGPLPSWHDDAFRCVLWWCMYHSLIPICCNIVSTHICDLIHLDIVQWLQHNPEPLVCSFLGMTANDCGSSVHIYLTDRHLRGQITNTIALT
jgi:hypothetical protein